MHISKGLQPQGVVISSQLSSPRADAASLIWSRRRNSLIGRLCNACEVKSIRADGVSELSCKAGRGMCCRAEKLHTALGKGAGRRRAGLHGLGQAWETLFLLCLSPKMVNDSYPSLLCHCAWRWPKGSTEVSGLIHKKAPKDELTSFAQKRSRWDL